MSNARDIFQAVIRQICAVDLSARLCWRSNEAERATIRETETHETRLINYCLLVVFWYRSENQLIVSGSQFDIERVMKRIVLCLLSLMPMNHSFHLRCDQWNISLHWSWKLARPSLLRHRKQQPTTLFTSSQERRKKNWTALRDKKPSFAIFPSIHFQNTWLSAVRRAIKLSIERKSCASGIRRSILSTWCPSDDLQWMLPWPVYSRKVLGSERDFLSSSLRTGSASQLTSLQNDC